VSVYYLIFTPRRYAKRGTSRRPMSVRLSVTLVMYHTLARYCESVLRATTQVNGKTGNSTPCHAQTP